MCKKLTYKHVGDTINSVEGYKLLSTEYKTSVRPLIVMCPKGHTFYPMFYNFLKGTRCNHPECKNTKIANSNSTSYDVIQKYIEDAGYVLLSDTYNKAIDKLKIKCPNEHIFKMRYSAFHQGQRCPTCAREKRRTPYDDIKEFIEQEGYSLLSSEYIGAFNDIRLMCPKKHQFTMRYNSFQQGQRCPICALSIQKSKPEVEICNYIKDKYNYEVISGDRSTVINPKSGRFLELDILLPEINKAIEYNAIHWHEGEYVEYKDNIKKEKCKELNIDLLVIDHHNWIKNKDFTMIDDFINKRIGDMVC